VITSLELVPVAHAGDGRELPHGPAMNECHLWGCPAGGQDHARIRFQVRGQSGLGPFPRTRDAERILRGGWRPCRGGTVSSGGANGSGTATHYLLHRLPRAGNLAGYTGRPPTADGDWGTGEPRPPAPGRHLIEWDRAFVIRPRCPEGNVRVRPGGGCSGAVFPGASAGQAVICFPQQGRQGAAEPPAVDLPGRDVIPVYPS
jgi:hypothetical protein